MARRRASMREGPLAELFRATEAAQRQAEGGPAQEQPPATPAQEEPEERTVEHSPTWEETARTEAPAPPAPVGPPPPRHDAAPPPVAAPPPPPVTRYVEPMPEAPPRLYRAPGADTGAYLAV